MTGVRTRTGRIACALAVSVVLAVLAMSVAAGRDASHQGAAWPSRPAAAEGSPLRLVTGTAWVNGMYTRYPHTQAGAVSAAVEFMTELGSTLDPDRAATVARLAADLSYHAAAQDAAASAIAARRLFGLPGSGPLPQGTAAFLVPVMYQVRGQAGGAVGAGQLTVLLLFDYTMTARSGITEHLGVTAVRLAWTPASWRLLPRPAQGVAALLATPGTAGAAAKGWEAMSDGM